MTATVFEVEQAGCVSCAARVRGALAPLAAVDGIEIDEDKDTATVRLAPGTDATEVDVNRALLEASHGSGHVYRVKPGSWHLEP
ncbi:MAG TPA: heavy-metal-associated domain-containing protein [Gaiellaceae bacterium]